MFEHVFDNNNNMKKHYTIFYYKNRNRQEYKCVKYMMNCKKD